MFIELIQNLAELRLLIADWAILEAEVPFRSWEWCVSWWSFLKPSRSELFVIRIKNTDGTTLGIAPWYLHHHPLFGKTIRFLGDRTVSSDYSGFVIQRGKEALFLQTLKEYLLTIQPHWNRLSFASVAESEEPTLQFIKELNDSGFESHFTHSENCWQLSLPSSWEEFVKTKSSKHRTSLRKLAESANLPNFQIRTLHTAEEVRNGISALISLHLQRKKTQGIQTEFENPAFCEFHDQVAQDFLKSGRLLLRTLESKGETVAVQYDLLGKKRVYGYASGFKRVEGLPSPGKLMFVSLFRKMMAEEASTYDFLRGDEEYKSHWGAKPTKAYSVAIFKRGRLEFGLRKLAGQSFNVHWKSNIAHASQPFFPVS